jgi:hypothetical protein
VQQFSQGMCKPFSIISIDEIEQLKAEEADAERSKLEGMTDHRIDELVEWVEPDFDTCCEHDVDSSGQNNALRAWSKLPMYVVFIGRRGAVADC